MSADIGMVIRLGVELERMLTDHFDAEGKGLGEKLKSVQDQLPTSLTQQLWQIVSVRNKAAHEAVAPSNIEAFLNRGEAVKFALQQFIESQRSQPNAVSASGYADSRGQTAHGPVASNDAHRPVRRKGRIALGFAFILFIVWIIMFDSGETDIARNYEARNSSFNISSSTQVDKHEPVSRIARNHQDAKRGATPPSVKPEDVLLPDSRSNVEADDPGITNGDMDTAIQGRSVYVKPSPNVSFNEIRATLASDGFRRKKWMLIGTVQNTSGDTLSRVEGKGMFYIPGYPKAIGPIEINWHFGSSGLAVGESRTFKEEPGGIGGSYKLESADIINAESLGAVITLTTTTDGMGKDHSVGSLIHSIDQPRSASGYRGGNGFDLAPNPLVSMSDVRAVKEPDSFGRKKWMLHGTITNKTSKTLSMVYIRSTVYIPDRPETINGVQQVIYLGQSGLAPASSTTFKDDLAGFSNEYSVNQPTVLNAKTIGVLSTVTKAVDGMNDTIYP